VELDLLVYVNCLLEASNFSLRDSLVGVCEFKSDVSGWELLIANNRR
jgi:hypothetical protein